MPNHRPHSTRPAEPSRVQRIVRIAPSLLVSIGLLPLAGCLAYSHSERDLDRTPIVNVGSRASIIYPGQSAPAFPTLPPPPGSAGAQNYSSQNGPNGQSGQSSQYGAPTGQPNTGVPYPPQHSEQAQQPTPQAQQYAQPYPQPQQQPQQADPNAGMTMLGGAREDITRHSSIREDPLMVKYLTAPLVAVAAPFVLAKEAIVGEPEPGPELPRPPNPTSQPPQRAQPQQPRATHYEERRMQDMARELAQRQAQREHDMTQQAMSPEPTQTASVSPGQTRGMSIADELEALRRQPESPRRGSTSDAAPRQPASTSSRRAAPTDRVAAPRSPSRVPSNSTTADGIVDRNSDGRIDHWIFRKGGEIEREEFDEDFNGTVDRIIYTDLESHQVRLVEEDNHGAGVIDTWTEYRDGAIARRRSDSDGDGAVDTWSFYHGGELVRHEQDTTHDGFRDAITTYRDGLRISETRDLNADGLPDVELFYDANDQMVRREEDADGDGQPEVIAHYENGRLVRKELLDAPELAVQRPAGDQ